MNEKGRRNQRTGVGVITLVASLMLAACSGEEGISHAASGEIELSMTYQAANAQVSPYESLAKTYMENNPDVTITLNPQPNDSYPQTLRTQLQAGNAPDIVQTSPGRGQGNSAVALGEAGYLEPLGAASEAVVPQGSDALFGIDGIIYGQPMELTVTGIVFNDTAAEEAGAAEFPEDFSTMLSLCEEVGNGGGSVLVVAGSAPPNTGMMAMAISASHVYASEPDWNTARAAGEVSFVESAGWRSTLETIVDLHDAGCFQSGVEAAGFDAITTNLVSGKGLGAFVPSAVAKEITNAAPETKLSVRPFPVTDGGEPYVLASSNYSLSINAASPHKEAAEEFLEWVAQPEQAALFAELSGALPVSGYEDAELSDTMYAPVAPLLSENAYAPLPNNMWPNPSVYEALGVGVQGLLTGQREIEEVLLEMDAAWDE